MIRKSLWRGLVGRLGRPSLPHPPCVRALRRRALDGPRRRPGVLLARVAACAGPSDRVAPLRPARELAGAPLRNPRAGPHALGGPLDRRQRRAQGRSQQGAGERARRRPARAHGRRPLTAGACTYLPVSVRPPVRRRVPPDVVRRHRLQPLRLRRRREQGPPGLAGGRRGQAAPEEGRREGPQRGAPAAHPRCLPRPASLPPASPTTVPLSRGPRHPQVRHLIAVPRAGGGEVVWSAGSSSVAVWCAQTHVHLRSVMDTGEAAQGDGDDGGDFAGKNMGGVASAGADCRGTQGPSSLRAAPAHVPFPQHSDPAPHWPPPLASSPGLKMMDRLGKKIARQFDKAQEMLDGAFSAFRPRSRTHASAPLSHARFRTHARAAAAPLGFTDPRASSGSERLARPCSRRAAANAPPQALTPPARPSPASAASSPSPAARSSSRRRPRSPAAGSTGSPRRAPRSRTAACRGWSRPSAASASPRWAASGAHLVPLSRPHQPRTPHGATGHRTSQLVHTLLQPPKTHQGRPGERHDCRV